MNTEADLAAIDAYMREAAVRAVADAVRAHAGTLELASDLQSPVIPALSAPLPARQGLAYTTVTPVPIERYEQPDGWWRRHWHHALIGTAVATFVGLTTWAVISIITAAEHAATEHGSGLVGVLVIVAIVAWMCTRRGGGGGGKSFSGTFTGRMN